MNLKIKGTVEVTHYEVVYGSERSFVREFATSSVNSQLVVKDNKALVWNFDSDTGSKEIKRETHKFIFKEVSASNYTAHDGTVCKMITFVGEYKWQGKDFRQERLRLSSFSDFADCTVDLDYVHNNKYRGKDFQRVSGYMSFKTVEAQSQIDLQNLYNELLDK